MSLKRLQQPCSGLTAWSSLSTDMPTWRTAARITVLPCWESILLW